MQPADRLIEPAVQASIDALDLEDADQAVAKLALRYARELDQASAVAAQAGRVLDRISSDSDDFELVSALKAKLSARSAVENIGPRLLNALDAIGATPKARKNSKEEPRGESKLAAFIERVS